MLIVLLTPSDFADVTVLGEKLKDKFNNKCFSSMKSCAGAGSEGVPVAVYESSVIEERAQLMRQTCSWVRDEETSFSSLSRLQEEI